MVVVVVAPYDLQLTQFEASTTRIFLSGWLSSVLIAFVRLLFGGGGGGGVLQSGQRAFVQLLIGQLQILTSCNPDDCEMHYRSSWVPDHNILLNVEIGENPISNASFVRKCIIRALECQTTDCPASHQPHGAQEEGWRGVATAGLRALTAAQQRLASAANLPCGPGSPPAKGCSQNAYQVVVLTAALIAEGCG